MATTEPDWATGGQPVPSEPRAERTGVRSNNEPTSPTGLGVAGVRPDLIRGNRKGKQTLTKTSQSKLKQKYKKNHTVGYGVVSLQVGEAVFPVFFISGRNEVEEKCRRLINNRNSLENEPNH